MFLISSGCDKIQVKALYLLALNLSLASHKDSGAFSFSTFGKKQHGAE